MVWKLRTGPKVGFALYRGEETRVDDTVNTMARAGGDDTICEIADKLYGENVRIVAASWGPITNPNWRAGGLWMSFYSPSDFTNDGIRPWKQALTRPDPPVSGACQAEGMDRDDEQLLRRRVYGTDHNHPARGLTGATPDWSAARWTACCSTSPASRRTRSTPASRWSPSWGSSALEAGGDARPAPRCPGPLGLDR